MLIILHWKQQFKFLLISLKGSSVNEEILLTLIVFRVKW